VDNDDSKETCKEDGGLASKLDDDDSKEKGREDSGLASNVDEDNSKQKADGGLASNVDKDDSKEKCKEDGWSSNIPTPASSSTSKEEEADGSRTISKEEQKLLDELRQITESAIEKCFEMDKDLFNDRLDVAVAEKKNLQRYLQKVNAKYQKWKDKESPTALPEYVSIPSQVLHKWFQYRLDHDNVLFQVRKIEGDGNCLYRSLSEYMILKQRIPKYISCEPHQYLRNEMSRFAEKNKEISFLIWKLYVDKKKGVSLTNEDAYRKWVESLTENKIWGGQAEYVLFAYTFQIHVICVRQLSHSVEVICSKKFQEKIKADQFVTFGKTPKRINDVVFIWHHILNNPRRKLVGGYYNGNHYSFLQFNPALKGTALPDNTFF
jgi:hypothetical protein